MPHLFVNRPRLHCCTSARAGLSDHFKWESINAVLYEVGGEVFIFGSVLFFPRYEADADLGAGVFFFGLLLYLVVAGHDMAEVWRYWREKRGNTRSRILEFTAAIAYLSGTLLFTVGSVFFLSAVGWMVEGGWCFVIGSLLFLTGRNGERAANRDGAHARHASAHESDGSVVHRRLDPLRRRFGALSLDHREPNRPLHSLHLPRLAIPNRECAVPSRRGVQLLPRLRRDGRREAVGANQLKILQRNLRSREGNFKRPFWPGSTVPSKLFGGQYSDSAV